MNIVFDIDGTLADCTHRLHYIKDGRKDWGKFFDACGEDAPIKEVIAVLLALLEHRMWGPDSELLHEVELWSGRPERCRRQTETWLAVHGLPPLTLRMRADGDHRPDHVMKMEFLEHFKPDLIFDDRRSVVDAWRARGIKVCHVSEGNF